MNDNDPTNVPPPIAALPQCAPPPAPDYFKLLAGWVRKFFACNPFYLVSAALLLYGCYRVSFDAPMFNWETARVLFNFFSVQAYEILLVFTAIFLARRKIWYDSTLLVGLENLLVFVPFILISLAALIDSAMAFQMCLIGAAAAVFRFRSLKKYFTQLNLPSGVLKSGAVMLLLNVALPLIYRHFGQTKLGSHIEGGAAYEMNEVTWLLILPAALALANLLPRGGADGDLPPQRRWLPPGMYSLWMVVTCVHVYALGYIYQFALRSELIAPCAWVLAWTACLRLGKNQFLPKYALMIPPALVPLLAFAASDRIFFILAGLNLVAYGGASLLDRQNRLARYLFSSTVLLLVTGLPENCQQFLAPGLLRAHWAAAGLVGYLLFYTALSRNPKLAIVGSFMLGATIFVLFKDFAGGPYWAVQGAFVFFLLHSLRWNDGEHPGANIVRKITCLVWVGIALLWMDPGPGQGWMPCFSGALVLGVFYLRQICFRRSGPLVVPMAAVLVALSGPVDSLAAGVREWPAGLLAVVGSFTLFTLGTAAALTRHLWHKHPQADDVGSAPKA
jgi:hypothetical protein